MSQQLVVQYVETHILSVMKNVMTALTQMETDVLQHAHLKQDIIVKSYRQSATVFAGMDFEQEQKDAMMESELTSSDANQIAVQICRVILARALLQMYVLNHVETQSSLFQSHAMTGTTPHSMDAAVRVLKRLAGIVPQELVKKFAGMD